MTDWPHFLSLRVLHSFEALGIHSKCWKCKHFFFTSVLRMVSCFFILSTYSFSLDERVGLDHCKSMICGTRSFEQSTRVRELMFMKCVVVESNASINIQKNTFVMLISTKKLTPSLNSLLKTKWVSSWSINFYFRKQFWAFLNFCFDWWYVVGPLNFERQIC